MRLSPDQVVWPGTCVVFLDKTLYSHSASLHLPGRCINGYSELKAGGNPTMDSTLSWESEIQSNL